MNKTDTKVEGKQDKMKKSALVALSLAALGIVYGDIGTSPLYAINEIFLGANPLSRSHDSVMGLISVVIWALIIIVAIKYVILILRADNDGEGGVFALLALLKQHRGKVTIGLITLLTFAAGLLFGDGVITPAISVLSAVEGLKIVAPSLSHFVIPITIGILTGLFVIQAKGTAKIGKIFGPIILIWFIAIASLGVRQIINNPEILMALNPLYALRFIVETKPYALLLALGSVMLVVTGGEALYADMGHFGRSPIRLSWFSVVMPCLIMNYLGQGAYLLSNQAVIGNNLFYSLVPQAILIPMVVLATVSTVIASQALISGCFSLAAQGIALGLLPRLKIKNTHEEHFGQIYLASVNWALFVGCIWLVLSFKSSANLAAAYGLAVSAVMLMTAISATQVALHDWKWPKQKAYLIFGLFALVDSLFLTANGLKFFKGGYVPVTIGISIFILMRTWQWGKSHVRTAFLGHSTMSMKDLLSIAKNNPRLAKNVLILTIHNPKKLSSALPPLAKMFINKFDSVPEHFIILTVSQTRQPYIEDEDRYEYMIFENNKSTNTSVISINAKFGFMEKPNVEKVINDISANEDVVTSGGMKDWIIYAGREIILSGSKTSDSILTRLRISLYKFMLRNTSPSYEYFGLEDDSRLSVDLLPVRIR